MLNKRVAIVVFAILSAACGDIQSPASGGQPSDGVVPDRPRLSVIDSQSTSCGPDCMLVPGPIPGSHSETRDAGPLLSSGEVTILWPTVFNDPSWVEMSVSGTIKRRYTMTMTPSLASYNGLALPALDADGMYVGSFCHGHFVTDFRKWGSPTNALHACTRSPSNWMDGPTVTRFAIQGVVEGAGNVVRLGMTQPTWPGYTNCGNGPCVFLTSGNQTVTISPASDKLTLTASPSSIVQGDTVTFTLGVSTFTFAAAAKTWTWVPHRKVLGGVVVDSSTDSRTGSCSGIPLTCVITVDRTGVMYARALLVPARVEQASARVVVTPLTLKAIPDKPQVGTAGDTVTLRISTSPKSRPFTSITVTSQNGGHSGTCIAGDKICRITVNAPDTLLVNAVTTQGIPLSTTVFIDSIPCPTGDATLDLAVTRLLLDSLWRVGGDQPALAQRMERGGIVIDSAGVLVFRVLPITSSSGPCTTENPLITLDILNAPHMNPPQWIPGVMTIVAVAHTHPYRPSVDFTPLTNCPPTIAGQRVGEGPSGPDWNNYYNALDLNRAFGSAFPLVPLLSPLFRSLVIDADKVWTQGPWSGAWRADASLPPNYIPNPVQVGVNVQGFRRARPNTAMMCMARSSQKPTVY